MGSIFIIKINFQSIVQQERKYTKTISQDKHASDSPNSCIWESVCDEVIVIPECKCVYLICMN